MAKTDDPQSGPQDAIKDAPIEKDKVTEILVAAMEALQSGAADDDTVIQNTEKALARVLADGFLKLTQAAIDDEPDAVRKLQWTIAQYLSRNNDKVITLAQENAGTPELAAKIEEVTRIVAINAFCQRGPGEENFQQVKLLAIPLMLTLPHDDYPEVPRALSQEDADWLAQAFAAHGLMDPANEQLLFAPQLWRTAEIVSLPYPKVWALAQGFSMTMADKTPIAPEEILGIQPETQETAPGQVNICLRYVVGAFAYPPGSEPSASGKEDTEAKLEAWQNEAAQYLGSRYHCKAEVCAPDSLYRALEKGWFWCHMSVLGRELTEALHHYRILPAEIAAVISLHVVEEGVCQLHIGYTRYTTAGKPELLGGSIWPVAPFEDPNDVADSIRESLDNNGIAAVEIVGEIQAGFNGQDGEPFLRPTRPAAPDPSGHIPAPTHMQ
jgi:hypothetical protein